MIPDSTMVAMAGDIATRLGMQASTVLIFWIVGKWFMPAIWCVFAMYVARLVFRLLQDLMFISSYPEEEIIRRAALIVRKRR